MRNKTKIVSVILFLSIIIMLVSCQKQKKEWKTTVETENGVKVVMNPGYPRDGTVTYDLEEEFSVGMKEGDEKYIFNNPQDIRVTDDGAIYILDWRDNCIKVYNNQGKHLRTIGREGQGPGEFRTPCYFSVSSDGRIYLMDSRNSRVVLFNTAGTYISEFRLIGARYSGMETDNNNFIYFSKEFSEGTRMMSIHRYNTSGEEILNFCKFKIVHPIIRKPSEYSPNRIIVQSLPTKVWNITDDGRLYVGYDDRYQIDVYESEGELAFRFGREYSPIPDKNSKGVIKRYKYMSFYARHRLFDESGNLWIEIFNEDDKENIVYDVFSPEGIYLKQAHVKYRISLFKKGRVYSIISTDEGYKTIKRFRMIE